MVIRCGVGLGGYAMQSRGGLFLAALVGSAGGYMPAFLPWFSVYVALAFTAMMILLGLAQIIREAAGAKAVRSEGSSYSLPARGRDV